MSSGEDRLATALERALKPPWAVYRNVAWLVGLLSMVRAGPAE